MAFGAAGVPSAVNCRRESRVHHARHTQAIVVHTHMQYISFKGSSQQRSRRDKQLTVLLRARTVLSCLTFSSEAKQDEARTLHHTFNFSRCI